MARGSQRVTDRDRGWKQLVKGLHALSRGPLVTVGVHEREGARRSDDGEATVAEYATYNEFGLGVPERSFLRATVDARQSAYLDAVTAAAVEELRGGPPLDQSLALVGEQAASDVRDAIKAGINPPNSPLTIRLKGSSTPLVDTGRLRQSITYEVHPKGRAGR